ncbi:hypothetical protein ACTQYZ_01460 [Anaerofustis sp. LCP19S3_F7]|uniref:hypothetical protein n=1 Tax=Anaerofustis sp. LCP19S3_F7 TaxID=3440247 RepID=UPI003F8EEA54
MKRVIVKKIFVFIAVFFSMFKFMPNEIFAQNNTIEINTSSDLISILKSTNEEETKGNTYIK